MISARVFARSGRAEGWLWLDPAAAVQQYVQRVPWFVRLDAKVAYEWAKPGRRMRDRARVDQHHSGAGRPRDRLVGYDGAWAVPVARRRS